jgi:hypothetical protein
MSISSTARVPNDNRSKDFEQVLIDEAVDWFERLHFSFLRITAKTRTGD